MSSCANIVNRLQSDICLLKENWNSIELMAYNLNIDQAIFNELSLLVYLIPTTPNGIGIPLTIEASYSSSITTTTYSGLIVLEPTGSQNCVVFTTKTLLSFGERNSTGFFRMIDTLPIVVIDANPSILLTLTYLEVVAALQSCAGSNDNHTVSCEAYNALLVFLKKNFGIQNLTPSVAACFYDYFNENRSLKAVSVVLPLVDEQSRTNVSVVLQPVDEKSITNVSVVLPLVDEKSRMNVSVVLQPVDEKSRTNVSVDEKSKTNVSVDEQSNILPRHFRRRLNNNPVIISKQIEKQIEEQEQELIQSINEKAYPFEPFEPFEPDCWAQKGQQLDGDDIDNYFGYNLSLSSNGKILAVGAYGYNSGKGQVKVYEWDGTNWIQKGQPLDGDVNGNKFGFCVSLSSNGLILAVGAFGYDNDRGQAIIYEWNGTSWIQKGQSLDGNTYGDNFGYSVSLSSNGLSFSAGSYYYDGGKGQAKVYEWNGTSWILKGLPLIGENYDDYFGSNLTLSSDGLTLAVGAFGYNNDSRIGQTKVYEWNGTNWNQKGQSLTGDNNDDSFGTCVSLSLDGLILAVSAYTYINNDNKGQVKVYEWNGISWIQKGLPLIGENNGDYFGTWVSLSSDGLILAVGAYGYDNNRGQVKVYEWNGTLWIQKGETLIGKNSDDFGMCVSLSSDGLILAVGASSYINNQGQAKVYNYDCITREIYAIKPVVLQIDDNSTTLTTSTTESSSNDAIEAKLRALLEATETSEVSITE
jgi:hypothetical protein